MKLSAQEISNLPLILIVDKIGVIGEELSKTLLADYLVIFVSKLKPEAAKNIIHIPFTKKIPQVPDNKYEKLFIIDDGSDITRESVFSFVSLARSNSAPLYFLTSVRNIDSSHAQDVITEYAGVKVLVFGDLFDQNLFFDKNASVNKFILQAKKNRRIDVSAAGLSLSFPISFEDTIKLIVKAAYLNLDQRILLLFQPTPITDISLAHVFQKINPDITVDFAKSKKEEKIYLPQGGAHVISKYELEQKIRELNLEGGEDRKVSVIEKENKRKNYLKPFLLLILILLFVFLLPLLTTLGYSSFGYFELNNSKNLLESGKIAQGISSSSKAKTFFETGSKTSNILISESKYFGLRKETQNLKQKIDNADDLSQSVNYFLTGAQKLNNVYKGKSLDPASDFSNASNILKTALSTWEKVKAEGGLPSEYDQKFASIKPLVDIFANSDGILPSMLGFNKEMTYLVLLQNNLEIRPGGGKISSYGILKIKNSRVESFKTLDSKIIDDKYSAHVEPPFPIRRYESNISWKFSESNFDPDFVKSAIAASNLYSLETSQKVDGVIGTDLNFEKSLLAISGPVHVEGVAKNIDEENVLKISHDNSSMENFQGKLLESIIQKLQVSTTKSYFLLGQQIGVSISQKDLLFAFKDQNAQDIFTANNWSGALWDERTDSQSTISDYLGLSEANLGENNANYFVNRSVSKKTVVASDGTVSSRLQIAFKNSSSKKGEDYKNYLEIILPQNASLNSILVNNKEVTVDKAVTDYFVYESRGFTPPPGVEVNQTIEMGKSVFGLFLNIPSGQVETIALDYNLGDNIKSPQNGYTYSLKVYKQPGVGSYPFDLSFDLPDGYRVIQGSPTFSTDVNEDFEVSSQISQK